MADLRTLGYVDGMAWSLVWVQQEIRRINERPIHPLHVRKMKERERRLRPLQDLERRMRAAHDEAAAAFDQQVEDDKTERQLSAGLDTLTARN